VSDFGGLSTLLANFNDAVGGFYNLLNACFYLIGGIFALLTGWELKSVQDSRGQKTYTMVIVTFLTAVIFLYLPTALDVASTTLFNGMDRHNPLSTNLTDNGGFAAGAAAVMRFIEMVGLIAFGRGWFILRAVSQGRANEGGTGRAITHMVGGILAVNITTFGPMLGKFVGLDLSWIYNG
jgi:intracellular multiplication protein IcmC